MLLVLLAVTSMLPILGLLGTSLSIKVDPELREALALGEPTDAYVTAQRSVHLNTDIFRKWYFGDIIIYKVRLTSLNQLDEIANKRGVISIYAAKRFHHAPIFFLDPDNYPFKEKDIDNIFHKADGCSWTGRGVTVAIIDSGIDYMHPDFYDLNNESIIRVLVSIIFTSNGRCLFWEPYTNGTMQDLLAFDMQTWQTYGEPAFLDINGHGTHVAGIIAGRGWASERKYVGIAPGVQLVVIKAFDKNGNADTDTCISALNWVYNNSEKYGIKVLNLSWGATFASDGSDPLSVACDKIALDKHVLIFAAAGNEGNIPTTVVVPAVAKHTFAIGAWDAYYNKIAPFSSIGPTKDLRMKPDLMAAGVMIVSCKSQYANFGGVYEVGEYYVALSGTSMATPVVAGIAADFIEYYRYWHSRDPIMDDWVAWLNANVIRINAIKDFITGWGIPLAPHS